jgi:prophage antirepressor-like protein
METAIQPFSFEGRYAVRAFERDGEPWFVAADVCRPLDLANVSQAVNRLDEDEKDDIITDDVIGRPQKTLVVNESGLYSLILTSRKPEAKAFKRWITHEVIPAIRKTGHYSIQPLSPAEQLLAAAQQLVEHERRMATIQQTQAEQAQRLADIEHRQTAIEEGSQYFTVIAFANRPGRRIDNSQALSLGRYAGRYSRKHGYPIGQAPDSRYGHVNTYHADVLRAVFGVAEH